MSKIRLDCTQHGLVWDICPRYPQWDTNNMLLISTPKAAVDSPKLYLYILQLSLSTPPIWMLLCLLTATFVTYPQHRDCTYVCKKSPLTRTTDSCRLDSLSGGQMSTLPQTRAGVDDSQDSTNLCHIPILAATGKTGVSDLHGVVTVRQDYTLLLRPAVGLKSKSVIAAWDDMTDCVEWNHIAHTQVETNRTTERVYHSWNA
jgi:hypothetical protein